MGHRNKSRRHDRDDVNIEIGGYRGRSTSKRYVHSSETSYGNTAPRKRCCAQVSRRTRVLLARTIETVFVGVAVAMLVVLVARAPNPAYPPSGTGDHGAIPFIFAAALLGVISILAGLVSVFGLFNWMADMGPKRRFFRYTSPGIDTIFSIITGFAVWRTHDNLGDKGLQCYANMSNYQGCVMLMVAMVMIIPGALVAPLCAILESQRIKERNKTS